MGCHPVDWDNGARPYSVKRESLRSALQNEAMNPVAEKQSSLFSGWLLSFHSFNCYHFCRGPCFNISMIISNI
jgi:hypothetical protein